MEKEIIKHYTNGELTIVWKPSACIHSKNCWNAVTGMPQVFDPRKRPWITMTTGPSSEAIAAQVATCPSGALSTFYNKDAEAGFAVGGSANAGFANAGSAGAGSVGAGPAQAGLAEAGSAQAGIDGLNQQGASLNQQGASLNQQDRSLNQQDASLNQQDTSLNQQDASLSQQDASLNQQDTSLSPQDATVTKIKVLPNGPLIVHGLCVVEDSAGNLMQKADVTAFCRCGYSANKPYCDGSHSSKGFVG